MIRRLLAALLALALSGAPAVAADKYFSDCASGGNGTSGNPYCIDPDGGGALGNVWFQSVFDGSSGIADVSDGDTVYLCCGDTDGCGDATTTCTVHMALTSGSSFRPTLSFGTAVTIRPYPGDAPIISGDFNDNATCDAGDATNLIELTGGTRNGYHFVGPITFKRGCSTVASFTGANADIVIDGLTLQEGGSGAWGHAVDGIGVNGTGCFADASPGFILYNDSSTGDFTLKNSTLDAACGMTIRHILGTAGTWLVQNNDIYNTPQLTNDWGTYNWHTLSGQVTIYDGNRFSDFQNGISLEDRNRYTQITNNIFACKGVYDISADGFVPDCSTLGPVISITGGDDPHGCPSNCRSGTNADYTITGNKIYGIRYNGDSSSAGGWVGSGIAVQDGCRHQNDCQAAGTPWWCCTGFHTWDCNQGGTEVSGGGCCLYYGCESSDSHTNLIANNEVWSTWNNVGIGSRAPSHVALWVDSNTPVTVENNSLYKNRFALEVHDGVAETSVAHVVRDNLVEDSANEECYIASSNTSFTYNNCYDSNSGNTVYTDGAGTNKNRSALEGFNNNHSRRCNYAACDDTTNYCAASQTDENLFDLHLDAADTNCKNAGTAGASTDIDGTSRPQGVATDIGADEIIESAPAPKVIFISRLMSGS